VKAQQANKVKRSAASKRARNRRLSALSKDIKVARLARELRESREQQTTTAAQRIMTELLAHLLQRLIGSPLRS
jgi:hypothetical protein